MAKKKAPKKQKAWAVVDRETGEVWETGGWLEVYTSRKEARAMRKRFFAPGISTVSRVTITIED